MPRKLIGREPTIPVSFRIAPSIGDQLEKVAEQDGRGKAEAARIAIYQYLERNPLNPDRTNIGELSVDERMALAYDHAEKVHEQGRPLAKGMCDICDYYL